MAWWQTVTQWLSPKAVDAGLSGLSNSADWLRAGWGGWGGRTTTTPVTPQSAMTLSAYFACLRNISEDVAKLPLDVYRRVEEGKEDAEDHPVYALLHDAPNPDMTAITFRTTLTHHALSWGNGYAWILREASGEPVALYPLHPSRVHLERDPTGQRRYLVYGGKDDPNKDLGGWSWVPQRDMLHVLGMSWDGTSGYSILQLAQISLGLTLNAETFGAAFFENGASMSGVLEHPGTLSDIAMKHLVESFSQKYAGPQNAGKPAILEEGMKWTRVGIPPNDAQFLETRQFQIREVARWFRMPPHKIADLADAHFTNIEQQNLEYVVDTLQPWLCRWEQEINRKLFDTREYFAEHNVKGLLRGDHAARAVFYKTLFELGAMTTNEILEHENENPAGPEGDVRFVAANNLQPLRNFLPGAVPMMPIMPTPPAPRQAPTRNGATYPVGRDGL